MIEHCSKPMCLYNKEVEASMKTVFDSRQTYYKNPLGCVKEGEILKLRLEIPKGYNPTRAWVIFQELNSNRDFSVEMACKGEVEESVAFECEVRFECANIHKYYFSFIDTWGTPKFVQKKNNSFEGEIRGNKEGVNWQLTVYQVTETHSNMKKGTMCQIFPDRFCKYGDTKNPPPDRMYRVWNGVPFYKQNQIGQDFFGGNLQGIIHRLKYLKSLGVTVLYLNPIWLASSNHRYDTADYRKVDPLLGTEKDLKELISKAHEYGMVVILDAVFNHTGADSIYFNKYGRYPVLGAYNSKESPYYDWYCFEEYPDKYKSWWGFVELPTINQNSKSLQKYMFGENGTIDYWYSLGIDGIRLDVPDELPNFTLNLIYEAVKRNGKPIVIIGEVWEDASCKCNYGHRMEYFLGKQLTSVMNYPVKNAVLAYIRYGGSWTENLKETLITIFLENYPREIAYSLMNFVTSHDTVRAITKLAGVEVDDHDMEWQSKHDELSREEYLLGRKRLMMAYLMTYFFPGVPSIFYGDEIGMSGQKDALCRKPYNWVKRDKKLLKFFKELGRFRKTESEFFEDADFDVVHIDEEICILERKKAGRRLLYIGSISERRLEFDHYKEIPTNTKVVFSTCNEKGNNYIDSLEAMILEEL